MQRKLLDLQADQIELVLASHRIPSKVLGGTVTPRLVRFQLATRMDTRLQRQRTQCRRWLCRAFAGDDMPGSA